MAVFRPIFILLLVIISCVGFIERGVDSDCDECLELSLNINKWKQAYSNSNSHAFIVELTLKDENLQNWTELVTIQKFPLIQTSLDQYYFDFIEGLKMMLNSPIYSRMINKNENSLFFEWWIPANNAFAQHEWFKLIKTPRTTMILRYTTKKLDQVENLRDEWEKILESSNIIYVYDKGDL